MSPLKSCTINPALPSPHEKRKAEFEVPRNVRRPAMRARRGSRCVELAGIKGGSTEMEETHYPDGFPETRHVIQVLDAQIRSAIKAQNQITALETMLLANEAQNIKDIDELFNEWQAYNHAQLTKARVLFKRYSAEIETLKAEAEASRILIEKQKQELRVRDGHLAAAKERWA